MTKQKDTVQEPNCPNCGKEMERKEKMYALDGIFFSGLVCCNSLLGDGDEEGYGEFLKYVKTRHQEKAQSAETDNTENQIKFTYIDSSNNTISSQLEEYHCLKCNMNYVDNGHLSSQLDTFCFLAVKLAKKGKCLFCGLEKISPKTVKEKTNG